MSSICSACRSPIVEEEEGSLKCTECASTYHFGKCAGITEKSYKAKKADAKKTWRCPMCRSGSPRASCSEDNQSELNIASVLASINQKLECLPLLNAKVETMENSIQYMSKQFDDFEKKIKRHKTDIKELKKRVTELEERDEENRVTQERLLQEVNELEFRSRRLNLEIHGVSGEQGEDLMVLLNKVANKLEVPEITQNDIVSAHRLPARQGNVPGIIVHFTRQQDRDAWLKKKNALKNSMPRVYIQENLTRRNRELLQKAKDQAKEKGYAFAWYTGGKVLVRKTEGARAIHIKNEGDIAHL